MAGSARQALGVRGEELAVAELQRQGMEVLARNWRCRTGEIDVVAAETVDGRTTVVFCEVKCRSGLGFGDPLEAITWAKLRRLRSLAAEWMATHQVSAHAIRLDAIGVLLVPGQTPQVTHVRAAG
ncbi:MAG: YraN family protein [Friedmanniella sp.]|jgi:putative endonuclease